MLVLVLGAGQLAQMMSLAGSPLNITIHAYDVTSGTIVHPLTKALIGDSLATAIEQADVITAEFEHIPHQILEQCQISGKFYPSAEAVKTGGDRRIEKALLTTVKAPNAQHKELNTRHDFKQVIEEIGLPLVFKTALGGYDGKGQWRLQHHDKANVIWQEMEASLGIFPNQSIIAEQWVSFQKEVSLVGVRSINGEIKTYSLAENVHTNGVLSLSTVIDNPLLQQQAEHIFKAVADQLEYVGVLAIEFFDVDGKLFVNEIAPRVHNSGHWTQQGAITCQFENHLRAICGLPLGDTKLTRHTAMINILGEDSVPNDLLSLSDVHIHWYGKEKRSGRKMGHINVCADSKEQLKLKLAEVAKVLDYNISSLC